MQNVSNLTISLNGGTPVSLGVNPDGTWATLLNGLVSGANTIEVKAYSTDPDCPPVTKTITVIYTPVVISQCVSPLVSVNITSPLNGAILSGTTVVVEGTVFSLDDVAAVEVSLNG